MMNQLHESMNELNISRNGNNEMQQEMFQYESFCNVLYGGQGSVSDKLNKHFQ
jgi:hypothetical protein